MPVFDIIVFSILGLSALVGFLRGLVKEIFNFFSWITAAVMTYFIFPFVKDSVRAYIKNPQIAEYAAYACIFIGLLVLFSLVSYLLSSMIKNSALGGVDRSLGFGFGLARAIVILAIMDLGMGVFFTRSHPPQFLKETKTLQHVHSLGDELMARLPKKWKEFVQNNQKQDIDLQEKVIDVVQDLTKMQERNVEALANLIPQSDDIDEESLSAVPENTEQMDRLLDSGENVNAQNTPFLDEED